MNVASVTLPDGSVVDAEHPWPGLESFTERDCEYFNGRDEEIADLFRLDSRDTLTVLFGQSGLGKTSLLKAGLFPKLVAADFLPIYIQLTHSDAEEPLACQVRKAIEMAIDAEGVDAPKPRENEPLWAYFYRKNVDFWNSKNRLLFPVLVFDQFEEIFTLGRENQGRRERAQAFLEELADLVERRPPGALKQKWDSGEEEVTNFLFDRERCKIILSLREDYLSDLEGLREIMRSVMRNRFRIQPMNGENAFKVVVAPVPGLVDDDVATRLVQLVAHSGEPGRDSPPTKDQLKELKIEPALLSLVCRELNAQRIKNKQLTITTDLLQDSYHDILKTFYADSMANLPPEVRYFVEDRLLTRSGYRTGVALEDALAQKEMTQEIINRLVKRRLLRIEDRFNVPTVELTHDILTTEIRASRDARQKQAAESALAAERERAEREKQQAEAELAAQRDRAEREKRQAAEELAAEKTRAVRERKKTLWALIALAAAVLALSVAVGAGVFAFWALSREQTALQETQKTREEVVTMLADNLFDLRNKLQAINRLDLMKSMTDKTIAEMERLGTTDAVLYAMGAGFEIRGDISLYNEGQPAAALDAYKRSLAIFQSLSQRVPANSDYKFAAANEIARIADVRSMQGDLKAAVQSYKEVLDTLEKSIQEKAPVPSWFTTPATLRDSVADNLQAQGELDEALKLYQQGLDERQRRAGRPANTDKRGENAQEENNTEEKIDDVAKDELSRSYLNIGGVLRALGNLAQSLEYQQKSLAFRKELGAESSNVYRQHDLSQSYDRVGEALQDAGKLDEATEAFGKSEGIFEKLHDLDPDNVDWKRNFSVTLVRLANLTTIIGGTNRAAETNAWILKLREALAQIDETNTVAKDDLSEAYINMGDSSLLQGHLDESAQNYQKAFALRSEMAKKDATNLDRRELLAESFEKLGDISLAQGNLDDALQRYEKSREVRLKLTSQDPLNALRQFELARTNEKVGEARQEAGNNASALEAFRGAVAALETLCKKDPSNAEWQGELASADRKVAEIYVAQKDFDAASRYFQQSRDQLGRLTELAPKNSEWRASLCDTETTFAEALRSQGQPAASLDPIVNARQELANLDETNAKRQAEFARTLYLASVIAAPSGKPDATAREKLNRSKKIMRELEHKVQLTAEQRRWSTEIEQAK